MNADRRDQLLATAHKLRLVNPNAMKTPQLLRETALAALRQYAGDGFDFSIRLDPDLERVASIFVDAASAGPKIWAHLEEMGIPIVAPGHAAASCAKASEVS
jgi:hypothetical protein